AQRACAEVGAGGLAGERDEEAVEVPRRGAAPLGDRRQRQVVEEVRLHEIDGALDPFEGAAHEPASYTARAPASLPCLLSATARQPGDGADARFFTPRAAARYDSAVAWPTAPRERPVPCSTANRDI